MAALPTLLLYNITAQRLYTKGVNVAVYLGSEKSALTMQAGVETITLEITFCYIYIKKIKFHLCLKIINLLEKQNKSLSPIFTLLFELY